MLNKATGTTSIYSRSIKTKSNRSNFGLSKFPPQKGCIWKNFRLVLISF